MLYSLKSFKTILSASTFKLFILSFESSVIPIFISFVLTAVFCLSLNSILLNLISTSLSPVKLTFVLVVAMTFEPMNVAIMFLIISFWIEIFESISKPSINASTV